VSGLTGTKETRRRSPANMVLLALVLGLLLWSAERTRTVTRMHDRLHLLRHQLDSTRIVLSHLTARIVRQEKRLASVEGQARRSWGGVRNSELVVTRRWIRRLEQRIEDNTKRMVELGARVD